MNNKMESICFNQELGELLLFSSGVATAIRMNSPYSSEYNKIIGGLKQFGFGAREDFDDRFNNYAADVINKLSRSPLLQQYARDNHLSFGNIATSI